MSTLIERLRFLSGGQDDPHSVALTEAAAEIERQAAEIERMRANERSAWNLAVARDEELGRMRDALAAEREPDTVVSNALLYATFRASDGSTVGSLREAAVVLFGKRDVDRALASLRGKG